MDDVQGRGRAARTIVGLVSFHEAPAIDVNHEARLTILTSQHVEAADHLAETFADLCCPRLFLLAEMRDEAA